MSEEKRTKSDSGSTRADAATGRVVGPFRLGTQLGVGGMGIVYEAVYTKNGARVALKMLSPEMSSDEKLIARFEREMSILKKLKHPNIVKYYGGGKHRNQHFYAMELIPGGSIEDELKANQRLSWERVIEVAQSVCRALEYAHGMGIIHRDLKPGNLFVGKNGEIKLGDFGIARDTQDTALTAAGRTVGTYNYMAPEQIIGKPPVSRRTDLYALGCVMYELLTGQPPFRADNQADLFMMHINDDPESLRNYAIECPIWLERLIQRLLEKDPEQRPYDARSTNDALDEVKKRIGEGEGVVKSQVEGGATVLMDKADAAELDKAVRKKKKKSKRKKKQPFHETTWFLGGCLLLVIALIGWLMLPPSESALAEDIKVAAASSEPEVWRAAEEDAESYLERFPDGPNADAARGLLDRVNDYNVSSWLNKLERLKAEPRNPAEADYIVARELFNAKKYPQARDKYEEIATSYADSTDADEASVARLARSQIARVEALIDDDETESEPEANDSESESESVDDM